jgi:hypothetical protein
MWMWKAQQTLRYPVPVPKWISNSGPAPTETETHRVTAPLPARQCGSLLISTVPVPHYFTDWTNNADSEPAWEPEEGDGPSTLRSCPRYAPHSTRHQTTRLACADAPAAWYGSGLHCRFPHSAAAQRAAGYWQGEAGFVQRHSAHSQDWQRRDELAGRVQPVPDHRSGDRTAQAPSGPSLTVELVPV